MNYHVLYHLIQFVCHASHQMFLTPDLIFFSILEAHLDTGGISQTR